MSIVATDNKHYADIAAAIREKTGTMTAYKPEQMIEGIRAVYESGKAAGGFSLYETGEIIGDGENHSKSPIQIPISFEPSFVFVCLTDTTSTLDANHVVGGCIVKGVMCQASYRGVNTTTLTNGGFGYWFDGWTGIVTNNASYADGIFSWYLSPANRIFYNGASYTWIAARW